MVLSLFKRDKVYKPLGQISGYQIEKIIGEGRYGICYQVSREKRLYILKQLKRGMLKKAAAKVRFEEEILKSLHHDNIPRFIEKIENANFYGYILEFKEGRTFEEILYYDKHVLSREEIYRIGRQIIDIIKYLQANGVVHRDIRVPNTLYDGQKVNLIDFGLARWIHSEKYKADMDFAFLGDFLLHLYYSSFQYKDGKKRPWYEELELTDKEQLFLKKLMGIEERYTSIVEVEQDFFATFETCIKGG